MLRSFRYRLPVIFHSVSLVDEGKGQTGIVIRLFRLVGMPAWSNAKGASIRRLSGRVQNLNICQGGLVTHYIVIFSGLVCASARLRPLGFGSRVAWG